MLKLGFAVVDKGDGRLFITGRPYNDRDNSSLDAYEELLLQAPGLVEMEIPDFFKTVRRNVKRMKLKQVHLAVDGQGVEIQHA